MATILNVPYKSQYDPDASESRNDCGPACLAMMLSALGQEVSTNAVFRRTGAPLEGYVSMGQLMRAAESYGLPLEYHRGWSLRDLKVSLEVGRPAILLVHYGAWSQAGLTQSKFTGPHFVLAMGYDGTSIYIHDPLYTGDRREEGSRKAYTEWELLNAWGSAHIDCDNAGNCNPDYACLISTQPVTSTRMAVADPVLLRRLRAKAAYDGRPQPDLTHQATVIGLTLALGEWGTHFVPHRVQYYDTLYNLARAYYGEGSKYPAIAYFNGLKESDVIHDGDVLLIPEPTQSGRLPEDARPTGKVSTRPIRGGSKATTLMM